MLRLARLDQHPGPSQEPVDLSALALECSERARTSGPQHIWQPRIAAGLVTMGDEEMLRRAIDNLLANIATHTPAGVTATIMASSTGGVITVEVSDDGPGVRLTSSAASLTGSTAFPPPDTTPGPASAWPSSPRSPPHCGPAFTAP